MSWMLSEASAFTQKKTMTVRLQLLLCFAFVFTLLSHSSHSHLSHLNRCRGFVANIGRMGERKTFFSSMRHMFERLGISLSLVDLLLLLLFAFAIAFCFCF